MMMVHQIVNNVILNVANVFIQHQIVLLVVMLPESILLNVIAKVVLLKLMFLLVQVNC